MESGIQFVRLPDLMARRRQGRSTIYRLINVGLLPPPVKLGLNSSAWPAHEVDAIDRVLIAGGDEDAIRQLVTQLVAKRKVAA